MSTLATINGEALAVPGLRFWGRARRGRIAIICSDDRGAVELWTQREWMTSADPVMRGLGGVELHSPRPLCDFFLDPSFTDCEILPGGVCYADGSSLAYSETFLPLIDAGDSAGVLRELAGWHETHFGGAA